MVFINRISIYLNQEILFDKETSAQEFVEGSVKILSHNEISIVNSQSFITL